MRDTGVVLVAAGRSERFGGDLPKQYQRIGDAPVLLHALRVFARHPSIGDLVVVLPPGDAAAPPRWLDELERGRLHLVAGGATRRVSVAAGLAALPACAIVLVHDGARPFPSTAIIDAGIDAARRGRSAVPALPIPDTIKRADDFGQVLSTVERRGLWCAQTPQAFPRAVLARAHAAAALDDRDATDDAMLVEGIGEPVVLIAGSVRNLKITTPDDLRLAAWYAERPC